MRNKGKRVLALLLTAAVMLAVPVLSASAADLTFGTDGKVTNVTALSFLVGPDSDTNEFFTDIKTAKVQVDLYKVADAVHEASGENHGSMYVYEPATAYATILTGIDTYAGLKGKTNDSWRTMAQSVANTMFAGTAPTPDYTFASTTTGTVGPQNVAAGLYLVIAHGSDLAQADYVVKDDATNNVTTIANSDIYVYTYTPELISLPTTSATMGQVASGTLPESGDPYATYNTYTDENGDEHPGISTAGGDWQTSLTAMLKPVRAYRFGKLVVRKHVPAIEEHSDATFVFHVVGKLTRNGSTNTVYDDYLSITFGTGDGGSTIPYYEPVTKEYYIELPVGTKITVEEVYPGSCYQFVSQSSGIGKLNTNGQVTGDVTGSTDIIPPPFDTGKDPQALVFTTNDKYIPNDIHIGYGLQNTFERNGTSWLWYKNGVLMNGGSK